MIDALKKIHVSIMHASLYPKVHFLPLMPYHATSVDSPPPPHRDEMDGDYFFVGAAE
jgi:hypothetical protein